MVKHSTSALDVVFSALADPTRRAILTRLARGEATVTDLAEPFDVSLPAISRHLSVLEGAGLLVREKEGRVRRCRLVVSPMREAAEWIAAYRRFWTEKLDALDAYLEESREREEGSWPAPSPSRKRSSRSPGPSRPRARKSSGRGRSPKR
jgi:DNA-binding transcriptional ArsR family regulator